MFKNESMFLNGNKVNAGTIIGFEVVRNRSYFSPKSGFKHFLIDKNFVSIQNA